MLVISRGRSESVVIGDSQVIVTVVDIRGDKVRLGFTADESISIHRNEVYAAIKRDEAEAALKPK